MAITYESIATTTVGSATSTITFSSISGSYTDLRLVVFCLHGGSDTRMTFNSDTATNYSATRIQGNGTSAASARQTTQAHITLNTSGFSPALFVVDIFSYAGSTFKTLLIDNNEDNNGSGVKEQKIATWRSTSAITSITLSNSFNFSTGAMATLYGILKA